MKKLLAAASVVIVVVVAMVIFHHHTTPKPAAPALVGSYVSLGDSVAAGVGLPTDSDSSACDRTDESYSHAVAAKFNLSLTSLACSGATITSGLLGSQDVNNFAVKAQLDQLFALPTPKLITLTIGANDADWTGLIAKCYTGECGTAADTAQESALLEGVITNLQTALAAIKNHYAAAAPQVVVTGYYQVFPASIGAAGCSDLHGIDASELAWGRTEQAALNSAIQAAVSNSPGATFAPIDFSGHELCAPDSWVQGINSPFPYHPTAAGQAAIAKQLATSVKQIK